MKTILAIAGLDPSGGAGIHADIKTIEAHGYHSASIITAVTFQNTCKIYGLSPIPAGILERTLSAVFDDLNIAGVKIGLIVTKECAEVIRRKIKDLDAPKVLDPVFESTTGFKMSKKEIYETLISECTVITPNIQEASLISGINVKNVEDAIEASEIIAKNYGCSVVITGGHLNGSDVIYDARKNRKIVLQGKILVKGELHGTGCIYSSSLTCNLAEGLELIEACKCAKEYLEKLLKNPISVGKCLKILRPSFYGVKNLDL